MASRVSGAPEVFGELPMTVLAEEIETPGPGQVRALFTVASNPVLSAPGGARLAKALETLDFMVSVDIYVNETTRHADVILPGLSPLEEFHYDVAFPQLSWRNHARYSPPVLPAPPGRPAEWQTILKLAAIVRGDGAAADVDALDEAEFAQDAQRLGAMWLQSLLDIQDETRDAHEFWDNVRVDLFPDSVYVFTPKNQMLTLPRGALARSWAGSMGPLPPGL